MEVLAGAVRVVGHKIVMFAQDQDSTGTVANNSIIDCQNWNTIQEVILNIYSLAYRPCVEAQGAVLKQMFLAGICWLWA